MRPRQPARASGSADLAFPRRRPRRPRQPVLAKLGWLWRGGAAAVLTLAGGQGAIAQSGPLVLPAKQVTTDLRPARAYNQPQLVVHPTGRNILAILGANYNAGECLAFVSLDGGGTWRQGKGLARPAQYRTCVRPDLGPYLGGKFGADGTLYLTSAVTPREASRSSMTCTRPAVTTSATHGSSPSPTRVLKTSSSPAKTAR